LKQQTLQLMTKKCVSSMKAITVQLPTLSINFLTEDNNNNNNNDRLTAFDLGQPG